ncbi:MAG: hypothetical protein R3350_03000 [Saprospiraceae bacterium]|nr:hypothetical protein [Saprospiraceae bacterium]
MRFILTFLLTGLLISCGSSGDQPDQPGQQEPSEEQLWEEVMATHDEVMPEMVNINRVSRQLRKYAEEHPELASEIREDISASVQSLSQAEEAMYEWMNQLKYRSLEELQRKTDEQEALSYLDREREAIENVKRQMLTSLEEGERLLESLRQMEEKEEEKTDSL